MKQRLLLVIAGILVASLAVCSLAAADEPQQPGPLVLEDPPDSVVPAKPPTEEDADRVEALALYGAARKEELAENYAAAARLYQRAWRYHPKVSAPLEQLVPILFRLQRTAEFQQYALRLTELKTPNPAIVQQLALQLTEQGQVEKALKLYEQLLAAETPEEKKKPRHVLLLMESGRLAFLTGQHKPAAEKFSQVLKALDNAREFGLTGELRGALLGDASRTYTLFGESFLQAGRYDEAKDAFRTAHEVDRDKASLAFHIAKVHHAAGEHDKALEQLKTYFASQSTAQRTAPYELLGQVLEKLGRKGDLLAELRALRTADESNGFLAFVLAKQLHKAEQLDEAIKLYRTLADAPADEPEARALAVLSRVGLAAVYRQGKKFEDLAKLLGEVAGAAGDLEPLGDELEALLKDKDALAAIVRQIQTIHQRKQLDHGTALAGGLLAIEAKDFAAAQEFYEFAIEGKPEAAGQLMLLWGVGLLTAEQYDAAVKVFRDAIDDRVIPEESPIGHFYLATALEFAGKTDEALEAARHALTLSEKNPRLIARVAWIYYHAQRYDQARKEYQALVEKFESDYSSDEIRREVRSARLALSNICVIKNELPQAEEWLEQVLDEFPDDPGANNDLGYLWADQGKRLQRALKMCERAVAAEPDNEAYVDSLGWVLFRLGRYEEALQHLQKAASGQSPDGVILDHLGDAYLATKQIEKARQAWSRALESFDKVRDADKIKATREKLEQNPAP